MPSRDSHWTAVDGGKVFYANVARSDTTVVNKFSAPVTARYVRIIVHAWRHHVSMRAALDVGRDCHKKDLGAAEFNRRFWGSPHGIVKRVCASCSSDYQVMYYRRYTQEGSFPVYDYLKQNWRANSNRINVDFGIFSS